MKKITLGWLITLVLGTFLATNAQIKDPFTPRYSETVRGNFTTIANNMLSRDNNDNYNGNEGNHSFDDNEYVDIDGDNSTFNSSNATFDVPAGVGDGSCLVIKKAYLYWAAADKEKDNGNDNQYGWTYSNVKLRLPGQGSYTTYAADEVFYRGRSEHFINDPYVCIKDITAQVNALSDPFGVYQVANVEAKEGELMGHGGGNVGTSGGWQIVFVYEEPTLFPRTITFFDGYAHISEEVNNFNIDFSGFQTVPNGPVNADVIFGSLEGDRDLSGDKLRIRNVNNNYVDLSTPMRSSNNFFNSRITRYGQNVTDRTPASTNTLGFDAGVFNLDNTNNSILGNNQSSARIRLTSDQETYGLYLIGFSVEVYMPELDPMLLTTDLAPSNTVDMGDTFTVSFNVKNYGNDDAENLEITYQLPTALEFVSASGLPSGVTSSYNSGTRVLKFTVANNKVEIGDPSFTINFDVKVAQVCANLDSNFNVQVVANYTGDLNPNNFSAISSTTVNSCGYGDQMPTVIHINDASDMALSHTKVNVLCNGNSTGSINLTVTGGTAPYTYLWSNGATTQDLSNIPAGVYSVTVTDSNNCATSSASISISEPEAISIIITKQNATATGGCLNGQATASVTGGVGPYTYLWSASANNQTTQTATNLPSGTHTVLVTDANGCISEQGVVIDCINNCDAVIHVDNVTNVLCAGSTTGSATVSATSVANPGATFTFTWNTVPPQVNSGVTSSTINNLGAGVYTVSVTIDGTLCLPVEQSITITEPASSLNVTATSTDESGPSTGDGTATANATGGIPPYSYLWSPGGQTTQTITGLSAGTYTVTVTDANGCIATATTTVNAGTCQNLTASATATPVSCNGGTNGTATVALSGGVGPFTFSWSPGGQTTQTISGLAAGAYTVTVTDQTTLCTVQSTATVNQPGVLSSGIAVTNIACFGDDSGSLDLTVTGGTFPYTFLWSTGATTEDLFNLTAGNYSVTITDANGCTLTDSATVLQPANGLDLAYTTVNVLCHGAATGAIDVTVTGGTAPYTYLWNNGATTQDLNNVVAGSYNVTVTDANGCTISENGIVILQPTNPLSVVITKINATTGQGCADGQATATVTGGTAPYTYLWSASAGNQTTQTATNLPQGTHIVTITDANGCVLQQGVVIDCTNTCDAIVNVDSITDVLCTNDTTGSATVSASSIANPGATFTFTWNTVPPQVNSGVTSSTINNVGAGVYTVSVTIDGTVCLPVEQSITITEPANELSVTATATDESGPTTGDGTATAVVSGGTPPYTYLWAPGGQTTQTITGLSAGVYTVTVTDANGCTTSATVTVNPGTCLNLMAFATSTPVSCNGDSDGTATASVTGGSGSFTYLWNTGATTAAISGLSGGSYTVTVTDTITQCTAQATTTVNEPNALSSGIAITNVGCFGNNTGSLDLTVSGGTSPYTFLWSTGATTEDLFNLVAGTYSVTITDANGCIATNSATVSQPTAALSATIIAQTDIVCTGFGSVTVLATGGTSPYFYNIDGGTFQSSGIFTGLEAGSYTIGVMDANGCTYSLPATILANCILAVDDINDTYINLTVNGNVATNDENFDGPAGTEAFTLVSGPTAGGALVFNADGTYTFTPALDFVGMDTFVYQICDAGSPIACDTATVYINILPLNSPGNEAPIANADTNITEINVPVSGNVLVNDFDPDGDPIVVTGNTNPSNGTVILSPNGTYTYTPNIGFIGEDTFEYTICDNGTPALCDTAIVTINVIPNNGNITVANDDAYNSIINVAITGNVLDNDTDPEGDAQTVDVALTPVSGPSNGTLVIAADGSFTYTPNTGFFGTDQFVYAIFDNGAPVATDMATVFFTIEGSTGNTILAINDINDTFVNLTVNGDVGTNDDNVDGPIGTETFTLVSGPTAGGTLVFNADGTYNYTPALDYVGEDTFVYQICDAGNPVACDTAVVTIEIVSDPVIENDPPIANNDTNVTEMNIPVNGNVIVNDYDLDGDPIVVTSNTTPANGTVVVNPDGTYTYTPNSGFVGEDSFEYTICDNAVPALCDTATVTINVIVNITNITVANDDAYYGEIDQAITGNVLTNDNDPEDDAQTVDIALTPVSGPTNGTLVINANGSFTYTPDPGFTGNDQFVYSIFDNGAPVATDMATVYILVQRTPAPAIALVKTGVFNDENGDNCTDENETMTYTFTVTNPGNVPLNSIMVTDPLLQAPNPVVPIVFVSGDNGDGILQVTETWIYSASYVITQADIDSGSISNQATAFGTDEDGTTVTDLSDDNSPLENDPTVTILCQTGEIALVKTGIFNDEDGDGCSNAGETITYTFTVTNPGSVSLSNVTVTDPMIATITGPIGDTDADGLLDVSEIWTFSGTYAITQANIDAGEVINQATVSSNDPSGATIIDLSDDTSILENDPTVIPLCNAPSIALIKVGTYSGIDPTNGTCISAPGDIITYAFIVTNTGNVTLTNVVVTDPLVTMAGAAIPSLAPGASDATTFTATYVITQTDIDAGVFQNQATATGTPPVGADVTDLSDDNSNTENDPTITTICQNGEIAIVKTGVYNDEDGDGCSDVDETIGYTFTVTNAGNVTLSNVIVTDPMIAVISGPTGDINGNNNLDVTETWIYTGIYAITQTDIDAAEVTNQATATATDTNGNPVSDLSDDNSPLENDTTVTPLCSAPSIALIKVGTYSGIDPTNGSCISAPGDIITYAFIVTNTGNATLTNVIVTDPLVTMAGAPIASLAPGASDATTFTATYAITQADIDAGMFQNQATATGTPPMGIDVTDLSDDNSNIENDPTITTICQNGDIAIVKSGVFNDEDGDLCSDVAETIGYTFTVTNEGNVNISNVVVTDPMIATITGPTGDINGDGILGVSEIWTYNGSYAITQLDIDAGEVINQATVTGTTSGGAVVTDLSDDTSVLENDPTVTPLCQAAEIAVVKIGKIDGTNDCVEVGDTIGYRFLVSNQGNVTLSNIQITDALFEAPHPVVPIDYIVGDMNNNGLLEVTETWTYSATYTMTQEDIDNGEVVNQATATGIDPNGVVINDESGQTIETDEPIIVELCQEPGIAIVKTGIFNDEDGDGCSDVDETIGYTFTVTNAGNVSISNVTVTDPMIAVITGPAGDTDGDNELDVTETWTYTGSYAITQIDIDAGEVSNQATAAGNDTNGSPVSDLSDDNSVLEDDPTVTPLCQNGDIAIVKTGIFNDEDGDGCSDVDETIGYTFTVTNAGNVSISNVTVTDPMIAVITGPAGDTDGDNELDVTETWTYTGSYAITQIDIDAGEVSNQATAAGNDTNGSPVSDLSDDNSVLEDDPTVTPLCQNGDIAIVKTGIFNDEDGDGCSDVDETIGYTFTVTNAGNVSISNVTVTDPMIAVITGPAGDTDGDNELDVTETWTYTGSYAITQIDIDAGEVSNQATAAGNDTNGSPVSDLSDDNSVLEDDPTVTPLCQNGDIAIVKTGIFNDEDGDGCSDVDETIGYTFTVTNAGNVSISNVTVTDPMIAVITGPAGDTDGDNELDVTETWTYTGSYAITQIDIDAGEVSNQATAAGNDTNGSPVSDLSDDNSVLEDDPTVTPLCQNGDIAIVKTGIFNDEDGDGCSDVDETIGYTFTVTNAGNVSISNVTVTDPMIAVITGPAGDTDGDNELDVTETWTYTGSYAITQIDIDAGEVSNQATAAGNDTNGSPVSDLSDDNSVLEDDPTVTPLCQNGSIALIKEGTFNDENGDACADVKETIGYVFTVINTGNVTLTNVTINDPLVNVIGGPITLAPGDTDNTSFTAVYPVTQVDIDNGFVQNQATVSGIDPAGVTHTDLSDDNSELEDDPTITDLCQEPLIALIKVGTVNDINGNGCADVKETITYTFTVFNLGNVTLANVDIEDPLVNVVGGPITLAPGATDVSTFTATYLITQADINNGFVENQATVSATDPAGTVVSDLSDDNSELEDDPTITELCQQSVIALIKTGTPSDQNNNGCIDLGESITYDFVVTNLGNVTLTNVTVTDPMVAVIGGTITLAAGESDTETFSAVYTVTQADIDNGFVENQATAEGTTPEGDIVTDLSDDNSNFENDPTISLTCQDLSIALEKTGVFNDENGNQSADEGETISYLFTVTNTGTVSLFNIMISDPLPGIIIEGGPIAVLLPGESDSTTFTATYAITEDDIENGEVVNQALVTGEDINGNTTTDESDDPNNLDNVDTNGDGNPDDPTVVVLPGVLGINFEIYNGVTPNGDGANDYFQILGIENFPINNVKIFNRWGVLVYETDGYGGTTGKDNVFVGMSEGRATVQDDRTLPTGTYFYILTFPGPDVDDNPGKNSYNGYLYINR